MKAPLRAGLAMLGWFLLLARSPAMAEDIAQPLPPERIEERLSAVEQSLRLVAEGRQHMADGIRDMQAEKKVSPASLLTLCNVSADQSELLGKIGKVITMLERPENQAAMSPAQRDRVATARVLANSTPPKMDCAAAVG